MTHSRRARRLLSQLIMKTGYAILPPTAPVRDILAVIRDRHSTRCAFDAAHPIPEVALADLLEAARWAPTAHNMQNFEIVVIDDPTLMTELGAIEAPVSEVFVRENYAQLAWSREELRRKQVGVLAEMFPLAWRDPAVTAETLQALGESYLRDTMRGAPMVLVVTYDPRLRAPASEGDVLGMMSLGCVMQNLWLAAQAQGIGVHVMSTFATDPVATHVKHVLGIPETLNIAFAIALGYSTAAPDALRVRREVERFAHRNRYRG
jgi:nitroreductase